MINYKPSYKAGVSVLVYVHWNRGRELNITISTTNTALWIAVRFSTIEKAVFDGAFDVCKNRDSENGTMFLGGA